MPSCVTTAWRLASATTWARLDLKIQGFGGGWQGHLEARALAQGGREADLPLVRFDDGF